MERGNISRVGRNRYRGREIDLLPSRRAFVDERSGSEPDAIGRPQTAGMGPRIAYRLEETDAGDLAIDIGAEFDTGFARRRIRVIGNGRHCVRWPDTAWTTSWCDVNGNATARRLEIRAVIDGPAANVVCVDCQRSPLVAPISTARGRMPSGASIGRNLHAANLPV